MRGLVRLTLTEFLLELREPFSAFFSLVFPPLLVVIFGSIYGNAPRPESGGFGVIDLAVPGYIAMVISTVAVFNLPIALAAYRERGVLRQLALTPISPAALLASQLAARAS
ncbi:ABC transporter permease [Thermomicrobium sp.]